MRHPFRGWIARRDRLPVRVQGVYNRRTVNRTDVLQRIIDRQNTGTYLEIGVSDGDNFFSIRALQKIAVDPEFKVPKALRTQWMTRNTSNLTATYHEMSSDAFFEIIDPGCRFDLVFVDGLHTYAQSLRDVSHSLDHLIERGIVVLHDCNPPHAAAAHPADSLQRAAALDLPGWTGAWCGDVWKTICHLRSRRSDVRVFVLDCDYGLGIVMRGTPDNRLDVSPEKLKQMTYADLDGDRPRLLNLRPESYLSEFLATI